MGYWILNGIITCFLALSAYSYIFSASTISGVRDLGFPDFFRIQLAVLKVIAALCIIIPQIPQVFKEWSYAGTFFFLITALVAHIHHKDSPMIMVVLVALHIVLYFGYLSYKNTL